MNCYDWNTLSSISNIILCILTFVTLLYTVYTQRQNDREKIKNERRQLLNGLESTLREMKKNNPNNVHNDLSDLINNRRYDVEDVKQYHSLVYGYKDNINLIRSGFFDKFKKIEIS